LSSAGVLAWNDVIVLSRHLVSTRVGDETAILDANGGIYYGLNPTGTRIWEMLKKPIRISEIHRAMVEEYDVQEGLARQDLLEVLRGLLQAGLIEVRGAGTP
jgi:hypothetical protein